MANTSTKIMNQDIGKDTMRLNEWKASEGSKLPLTIIAKIVGVKNAKYVLTK